MRKVERKAESQKAGAADMNGDLNDNNDLVAEFKEILHDIPDLPTDHELLRWIHATSVENDHVM